MFGCCCDEVCAHLFTVQAVSPFGSRSDITITNAWLSKGIGPPPPYPSAPSGADLDGFICDVVHNKLSLNQDNFVERDCTSATRYYKYVRTITSTVWEFSCDGDEVSEGPTESSVTATLTMEWDQQTGELIHYKMDITCGGSNSVIYEMSMDEYGTVTESGTYDAGTVSSWESDCAPEGFDVYYDYCICSDPDSWAIDLSTTASEQTLTASNSSTCLSGCGAGQNLTWDVSLTVTHSEPKTITDCLDECDDLLALVPLGTPATSIYYAAAGSSCALLTSANTSSTTLGAILAADGGDTPADGVIRTLSVRYRRHESLGVIAVVSPGLVLTEDGDPVIDDGSQPTLSGNAAAGQHFGYIGSNCLDTTPWGYNQPGPEFIHIARQKARASGPDWCGHHIELYDNTTPCGDDTTGETWEPGMGSVGWWEIDHTDVSYTWGLVGLLNGCDAFETPGVECSP